MASKPPNLAVGALAVMAALFMGFMATAVFTKLGDLQYETQGVKRALERVATRQFHLEQRQRVLARKQGANARAIAVTKRGVILVARRLQGVASDAGVVVMTPPPEDPPRNQDRRPRSDNDPPRDDNNNGNNRPNKPDPSATCLPEPVSICI